MLLYHKKMQTKIKLPSNSVLFWFLKPKKNQCLIKFCNYNKNQYTDTRTDFWSLGNDACEDASFSNCEAKQDKNMAESCFVFYTMHNDMRLFEK